MTVFTIVAMSIQTLFIENLLILYNYFSVKVKSPLAVYLPSDLFEENSDLCLFSAVYTNAKQVEIHRLWILIDQALSFD
jgi:hypothetical protein